MTAAAAAGVFSVTDLLPCVPSCSLGTAAATERGSKSGAALSALAGGFTSAREGGRSLGTATWFGLHNDHGNHMLRQFHAKSVGCGGNLE